MANPMYAYQAWSLANPTRHEEIVERAVARLGERYRTQHLFMRLYHLADFALLDSKITIEVDGKSHDEPEQKAKDLRHMIGLKNLGWTTVRVTNSEVEAYGDDIANLALSRVASSRQTTVEDLQEALAQLHRRYPELASLPAKQTRRAKSRRGAAPGRKPRKKKAAARSSR